MSFSLNPEHAVIQAIATHIKTALVLPQLQKFEATFGPKVAAVLHNVDWESLIATGLTIALTKFSKNKQTPEQIKAEVDMLEPLIKEGAQVAVAEEQAIEKALK